MKILRFAITLLLLLAIVEIALRVVWGFGNPVLYSASADYEYMYAPNQHLTRFGNKIQTNSFGMRSPEPAPDDSIRILYIGDSVINGGTHTAQDNLSSHLLAESLSKMLHKKVSVLNISAGSWGPDNAAAFLKKHGTFNANAMIVVFSSHDAFDNMNFEDVIDNNIHYPGHKPASAISEVILRYFTPFVSSILGASTEENKKLMINNQRQQFNSGWKGLIDIAEADSIPLFIVLHAEQAEINKGAYNRYGQMIQDTLKAHNIPFATDLNWGISADYYRDFIHLNDKGQLFLAEKLTATTSQFIQANASDASIYGNLSN
jgi:hypothetical protein